ncbi:MAG: thioredoxin family protein, partial [Chthoniobacterales bacterium]
ETAPSWHTYWEYPGDAGIATNIDWKLPEGFSASAIQWPLPESLPLAGDILDYGYKDRVLLIVTITPPQNISSASVTLQGLAKWLVCAEICVPGEQQVELTLPVAETSAAANTDVFTEFEKQVPSTEKPPFGVKWEKTAAGYAIQLSGITSSKPVEFFPLPDSKANLQHPRINTKGENVEILVNGNGTLSGGVVVLNNGTPTGYQISFSSSQPTSKTIVNTQPASHVGLWLALFYGFVGGIILNLMPCVLPVISLKIFGFVKQAGDDPKKILKHGLAFVAGIYLWFLGLGVVVCLLRSGGQQVTWAFQFQNPYFNLIISAVVFIFALNLFGVFEIILPGSAATQAANLGDRSGYAGSFFQGIFATLLATPCTAPFLGTALGFAFSQSSIIILAMFAAVATGMAFPYFFLSANPGWMKFLPKPGMWMERMKQFMGFPLMATLLWLLYIIGQQRGVSALICASAFLLILGVCCWIYGAFATPISSGFSRAISVILILIFAIFGGWYFIAIQFENSTLTPAVSKGDTVWVPFSKAALTQDLQDGKAVFLDFTADWCVTCKFNERTAINTPAVREAFRKMNIVPMRGDWTNANPEITTELKKFGRVGVPFYVYYPAGDSDNPVILPEIITEKIVLDALSSSQSHAN